MSTATVPEATPYPDVTDTSHATTEAAALFRAFFSAKSRHDVKATHAHFSPRRTFYADATLGWVWPTNADLQAVWERYMPQWPAAALSYPTRILGDTDSALVLVTDTPELFGGEIRAAAVVDLEDGRIVRWVDYWDGRGFGSPITGLRTPAEQFPARLGEDAVRRTPPGAIGDVTGRLQTAFGSGDAGAAGALFSYDALLEDLAARTVVSGRAAITRYLRRALPYLPYGLPAGPRAAVHAVGGDAGGGYEWRAAGTAVPRGIVVLELDPQGRISRLTSVWDGTLLDDDALAALTALVVER